MPVMTTVSGLYCTDDMADENWVVVSAALGNLLYNTRYGMERSGGGDAPNMFT